MAAATIPINGEALRAFRILRGMSRQALALAAQSSYSHVANLETEEKTPSAELVHRIALVLDVPVGALTRGRNALQAAS